MYAILVVKTGFVIYCREYHPLPLPYPACFKMHYLISTSWLPASFKSKICYSKQRSVAWRAWKYD